MRFLKPLRRRTRDDRADNIAVYEPIDVPDAGDFDDRDTRAEADVYAGVSPARSATIDPDEGHAAENKADASAQTGRRPRRPRLSLPRLGFEVRFPALLLSLALVGGGIFGTLLAQGRLKHEVEIWWPTVIVVVAIAWMLIALVRQRATPFLGAAILAGAGLSTLMSTQGIAPLRDTLLGMVLVTTGLGIIIRGFLLRQRTPL